MYQCQNSSKCISINRLNDGIDDYIVQKQNLTEYLKQTHYQCSTSKTFIPLCIINDKICHCGYNEYQLCEDEELMYFEKASSLTFPIVCDDFTNLSPIEIDGEIHTDETECEN